MSESKKSGVSLSMGGRLKPLQSTQAQNVFGDDDSDEEKPQTSAEKFHSKYGNLKAKDERAVKKVMEENPDIYDFDGAYDSMKNQRSRAEKEKEMASKTDATPKYVSKLLEAKKKREFETLLRDERKQEKERKAEGEEFKGKDVFVTTAYRKQLEETVKFRKELEESDQIDERTGVQGQKMWRENFGKKLLEDRIKDRYGDIKTEDDEDQAPDTKQIKTEEDQVPDAKRIKLEEKSRSSREREYREADRREDRSRGKRDRSSERSKRDRSNERRGSDRHRERDYKDDRRYDDRSRSKRDRSEERSKGRHERSKRDRSNERSYGRSDRHRERDYKESDRHREDRPRNKRDNSEERTKDKRKMGYKEAERAELHKRMQAVRRILQQRNTAEDIEAARQRYFERRQAGLIVPPV